MAERINDEPPRVQLYRLLLNDKTPGVADKIKKYSFTQFENNLLNNKDAQDELGWYLESKNIVSDPIDFSERYLQGGVKTPPAPKQQPQPKVQAAPAQQFPMGIAAPAPIKEAAPSVTDIGREMAFKPPVQQPIEPVEPVEPIGVMAPEPIVEPAPSVTQVAREMAFKPPVQPKMPKEEEERGFGEWAGDLTGTILEGGKRITKNLLGAVGYYAQTQAATDPMFSLPYEKRQQMMQEAGQTMYDVAEKAQMDFQNEVAKRNIQTDVLQAIENKQYKKVPEAALYTVGDAAMQIIPSIFTMGGSSFMQTLPTAYRDGVEAIAKEKGMSPEQVIASGDDAIVTATITSGIVGALDKFGADRIGGFISTKAGYKAVRDWLLKQNTNKKLAVAAQLLGVSLGESGTEYLQEGAGQAGIIAAKSPTLAAFFEKLPNELFTAQAERQRRGAAVGGLVGGIGVAGAGRALKSALSTAKPAPPGQEEAQAVPAEEVSGTGQRVFANSLEEVPAEYRDKVMEVVSGPLATFGVGKKQYVYNVPVETMEVTPSEAAPVAPEAIEAAPIAEDIDFEEVSPVTEEVPVAPETEDDLSFLEEMRLTPEEETAPAAPSMQFKLPTLNLPRQEGFAPSLRKLGYTDEEISSMTLEQQQDIVINKTEPARAESSSKVDVEKENQRLEKVADAQRKLDEDIAATEASLAKEEVVAAAPVTPAAPVSGVEAQNTYTRDSMKGISSGTGSQLKGKEQLNPDKVVQKLRVGDEVTFFAEKERKGVWNGKAIIEVGTNNSWGIMGILGDPNGFIRNDTKIAEQSKPTPVTPAAPKAEPAKTNEEQIAILRAEEQAELDRKIKNADKYRGEDGKVDKTKLTKKADIKAFDEVYDKYDKLISPLMETKPAETAPQAEFTSKQESSASTEFDSTKKPSKIKMKSFDGKHGKGAFERMKNITDNFEDIMDGLSGKIKQDCL